MHHPVTKSIWYRISKPFGDKIWLGYQQPVTEGTTVFVFLNTDSNKVPFNKNADKFGYESLHDWH